MAFRRTDPACFATGGRDNSILIWDTRARPKIGQKMPKADNRINSGHSTGPGTPHVYRRGSGRQTPKQPVNSTSSSITGLAFQVRMNEFTILFAKKYENFENLEL